MTVLPLQDQQAGTSVGCLGAPLCPSSSLFRIIVLSPMRREGAHHSIKVTSPRSRSPLLRSCGSPRGWRQASFLGCAGQSERTDWQPCFCCCQSQFLGPCVFRADWPLQQTAPNRSGSSQRRFLSHLCHSPMRLTAEGETGRLCSMQSPRDPGSFQLVAPPSPRAEASKLFL